MGDDNINNLVENIVILSNTIDDTSCLNSSIQRAVVSSPVHMTSFQIKKEVTNRLEEKTRMFLEKKFTLSIKRKKCSDADFVVPSVKEHCKFLSYKYKKSQLQTIARHYLLPVSGTVFELTVRVYNYLITYACVQPFQSLWRGYLRRKCLSLIHI